MRSVLAFAAFATTALCFSHAAADSPPANSHVKGSAGASAKTSSPPRIRSMWLALTLPSALKASPSALEPLAMLPGAVLPGAVSPNAVSPDAVSPGSAPPKDSSEPETAETGPNQPANPEGTETTPGETNHTEENQAEKDQDQSRSGSESEANSSRPLALTLNLEALPLLPDSDQSRPGLRIRELQREVSNLLLLREIIETKPLVVGGLKLYLDAEPVASRQRFDDTSQLTLGIAPDRVVLFGAF